MPKATPAYFEGEPLVNVHLRAASAGDAYAAATILLRTRVDFMPYAPAAHSEAEIREWVRTQLIPTGGVMVAVQGHSPVAVMATSRDDDCSWINQMAVKPEHVGRGVGSQLLAHALEALAPPIRLYTFQANTGARRFYERHGFVATEVTDGRGNEERCPDVLYEHRGSNDRRTP